MAGTEAVSIATQSVPLWVVGAAAVISLILVPLFNLIKPYILTAEQREARAARLKADAEQAETDEMARLREERDEAIARYESEFRQRMELLGEHKFVTMKFAEMEVRHQECEASNRALSARMATLEAMVPAGGGALVAPSTGG